MTNKFDKIYNGLTVAAAAVICVLTLFAASPAAALATLLPAAKESGFHKVTGNSAKAAQQAQGTAQESTINRLTKTPSDILQLIEAAEKSAGSDIKDGDISEQSYSGSGTNVKIGNVWVRNNTETQQNINLLKYYESEPELKPANKNQPCVLIFHTHTTESYEMLDRGWYARDYITRSNSYDRNMVRVGMEIKEELERNGYTVIHDREIHDKKYTGAYAHSRKSVEKYLEQYPSIQIVLDIHRDAIEMDNGKRIKPTADISGKKAAQIMIITGCEEGSLTDFPNWEKNLSFALKLQSVCEEKFPGLMRPIYFCRRKYNMDLSANNLLVEMGSSANTLEEAAYSGRLLGNALAALLDSAEESSKKQ